MHADCEAMLLEDGSRQKDVWGANWIPTSQTIEFEALINIHPSQQNLSMTIQDSLIKNKVEIIARELQSLKEWNKMQWRQELEQKSRRWPERLLSMSGLLHQSQTGLGNDAWHYRRIESDARSAVYCKLDK